MHVSEDDLTLHYYGETTPAADAGIDQHLAECFECRAAYLRLKRVLAAVDTLTVPDVPPTFEHEVWERLAPVLGARRPRWWSFSPGVRRFAAAGAVAALVVAAFVTGRLWPTSRGPVTSPPSTPASNNRLRERVLLVAVGDHLERSQMILIELLNTSATGAVDISAERSRAEELLAANRLYRQTADTTGDTTIAALLDDLERILTEVAARPARMPAEDLERIRARIEADGLLFRVRVISSGVKAREKAALARRTSL
jgi:hypothetical protein